MEESEVRKVFQRVLQAAGLPSFRLDDLRHTFASLLLSFRAPLLDVSQQLGHDEPTLRHYAHWISREGQSFVSLLEGDPAETWHQVYMMLRSIRKVLKKMEPASGVEPPTC